MVDTGAAVNLVKMFVGASWDKKAILDLCLCMVSSWLVLKVHYWFKNMTVLFTF